MCVLTSRAQTTAVTGTVTDPSGLPYAGATMKVGLVFAGKPISSPTVTVSTLASCRANGFGSAPCQVPFSPSVGQTFTLDPSGNIPGGGITLQDNSLVTPAGTQWQFTINLQPGEPPPLGRGPQVCTLTATISGASQNLSINTCPAIAAGGVESGGGGGPGYILAAAYGVTAQAKFVCDAGITNASATVTTPATDRAFSATDVGSIDWGSSAQCGGENSIPIPSILIAQGTITVFNSAHSIATSQTSSGNCTVIASDDCVFVWGPDDTTAMQSAWTATSNNCGTLVLPAGGMILQFPIANAIAVCPGSVAANGAATGLTVAGQGRYSSFLLFSPSYTFTNTMFASGNPNVQRSFHDFALASFSPAPAAAAGTSFIALQFYSDFYNTFWLDLFPSASFNLVGVTIAGVANTQTQFHDNIMESVGQRAIVFTTGTYLWNNAIQNTVRCAEFVGGSGPPAYMHDNLFVLCGTQGALANGTGNGVLVSTNDTFNGVGTSLPVVTLISGTTFRFRNVIITGSQTTGPSLSNAGTVTIEGESSSVSASGGTANGITNSGTLTLRNTGISSTGGTGLANTATGIVIVKEGNTFANGITNASGGVFQGQQGNGVWSGSCAGVGTSASTLGLYGLGQFATPNCTSTVVNLGQPASKPGTVSGLFATATAAGTNASSGVVTVLKNNVAQALTCTIGTGTNCFDGAAAHSFSYVAGDVISVQFTTQAADTLAGVKGTVLGQ